jgi:integrase
MEKWKSNDPKSEYYFPFLDLTKKDKLRLASVKEEPGIDLETAYKRRFNKILSEKVNDFTRTMNSYLLKIAKKLKLKSHITSYSARHTFANKAIDKGVPPLRVMQAMGQKCFSSFMHYVNDLTSLSEMKEMLDLIDDMHKGVTVVKETGEKYHNEFEEEYENGEDNYEELEEAA